MQLVPHLCPVTESEKKLARDIVEVRRQQRAISMQDEFAKYAKMDRSVIKMRGQLDKMAEARREEQKSAKTAFYMTLYAIMVSLGFEKIF